jgi:hypothetical protein
MQMNSALCDVHTSVPFRRNVVATITLGSTYGSGQEDAFCCQNPGCTRCYSPWRGYYWATEGEYLDQGVPSLKPQCRHNSEPVYMFLMMKDGELLWACPEDRCEATRPWMSSEATAVLDKMRTGNPLIGSRGDYGRDFRLELGATWECVHFSVAQELIDRHAIVEVSDRGNGYMEYRPVAADVRS